MAKPGLAKKPRRLPGAAALAAAATRERKQRATETLKLAEHEKIVQRTTEANRTGRVVGVKIERRRPFDPEAGRYRFARAIPGAAERHRHVGMPTDAPVSCPSCGASQPAYRGRGRYVCEINRLVTKGHGCGHRWTGPYNRSESPLEASESIEWTDPIYGPPLPFSGLSAVLDDIVFS